MADEDKDKQDPQDDEEQDAKPTETLESLRAERDKWRRESRKWEDRAKQNTEKAKKYDEMESKNKTDTERLVAAEQKAAEIQRELIRTRVALRKGLTEAQAKRLTGDNEEDMESDAEELLSMFRAPDDETVKVNGAKRPLERLTKVPVGAKSGAAGSTAEPLPSREDIAAIVDRSMENR